MDKPPTFSIVFMGTPDFAVPSLRALFASGHKVELVITQPDKKKGRGRKTAPPPIKETAVELGLPLLQPESMKDEGLASRLKEIAPDFFAVVAFGRVLPGSLLGTPRKGTVNVHPSLLPKYRGPAPIQWAILNGDEETGVSTMFLDEGLDTGDVLLFRQTPIFPGETSDTLGNRLADIGAELLVETFNGLATGTITPKPQDDTLATFAPLLKKSDGHIDWNQPAEQISRVIRGMNPWPGAFTFYKGKRLKILAAETDENTYGYAPGTVIRRFSDELRVASGNGAVIIRKIQGESGKKMASEAFLRGRDIPDGELFE